MLKFWLSLCLFVFVLVLCLSNSYADENYAEQWHDPETEVITSFLSEEENPEIVLDRHAGQEGEIGDISWMDIRSYYDPDKEGKEVPVQYLFIPEPLGCLMYLFGSAIFILSKKLKPYL
jgi:hypothetical protein